MRSELRQSYALCRRLARGTSSNFYYSLLLLPREKRQSMCALYAFLRRTDDLGDGPGSVTARRAALFHWRHTLDAALGGEFLDPMLPALIDSLQRWNIPSEHLHAVIDGVEMDLEHRRYESFDDLRRYCYHVASVVGLCCIHVWGFQDRRALRPAETCGLAFQLTNILRDLKEDAAAGRVYLPQQDLRRFDYSENDLRRGVRDARFQALMRFQISRAERLYDQAAELESLLNPDGQRVFRAMTATYRGLLEEIKHRQGDVFTHPVRLSRMRRAWLAASGMFPRKSATRLQTGSAAKVGAP